VNNRDGSCTRRLAHSPTIFDILVFGSQRPPLLGCFLGDVRDCLSQPFFDPSATCTCAFLLVNLCSPSNRLRSPRLLGLIAFGRSRRTVPTPLLASLTFIPLAFLFRLFLPSIDSVAFYFNCARSLDLRHTQFQLVVRRLWISRRS